MSPGRYTITQTTGGTLRVGGLLPFQFPTGGTIIQDVGPATEPDCVHQTVVPFPGGFNAPTFCLIGECRFSRQQGFDKLSPNGSGTISTDFPYGWGRFQGTFRSP